MGESACLVRSFSHPSASSREDGEVDPIRRALTESISFGRFMSESLDWEKWSTFSQNRYLEEAEKFSKPGSVAQKKAYFEAHYKKKAAMREAALLQKENMTSDSIPESEIAETCSDSSTVEELAAANNHLDFKEQQEIHVFDNEMRHSAYLNACDSSIEGDDISTAAVERVETVVEQNVVTRIPALIENLKQPEIAQNHGQNVSASQEQIPQKEVSDRERPASSSKTRPSNILFKSLTIDRANKLPSSLGKEASSVKLKSGNKVGLDSRRYTEDSANKKLIEKGVGSIGKQSRVFISIKKSTPNVLNMSINLTSRASISSNSSGKISKADSTLVHNPTRTSVNGVLKNPSVIGKSEHRRTKTTLNKSVSEGIMAAGKSYSLISEHPKSSNASGSKTRAPIILSPFTFRSEERAVRRKEFFQKLEEKNKAKEVKKWQMQTKSKIPVTQPQSPKLGKKPMPTRVQEITSSLPPRRPAANAEISKRFIGNNSKQSTVCSVASPKKSALENASPNIQK